MIEQSPAAGEEVDKGDAVDLTVAQATPIPDVVDLTEEEAQAELEDAGFEVRVRDEAITDPAEEGIVLDQTPGGRRGAPPGQPGDDRRRPRRGGDADALADHGAMRVAVLAGGRSSEHEVSLSSAAFVREAVAAAGHEVLPVTIERSGAWTHDGEALALSPRRRACSAPTPCSPSCTGRSARTAPSRACSSCSTCPTSAPACSPPRCAWTRSCSRRCWPPRPCRRCPPPPCASTAGAPSRTRCATS